jgi:hypothetical protein
MPSAKESAMVGGSAVACMHHPRLYAALFSPQARGEVSLIGEIMLDTARNIAVSGQVDRLLVEPNRVDGRGLQD